MSVHVSLVEQQCVVSSSGIEHYSQRKLPMVCRLKLRVLNSAGPESFAKISAFFALETIMHSRWFLSYTHSILQ